MKKLSSVDPKYVPDRYRIGGSYAHDQFDFGARLFFTSVYSDPSIQFMNCANEHQQIGWLTAATTFLGSTDLR